MTRTLAPKSGVRLVCVTANRLADGAVVWLTAAGAWSERIADAAAVEKDALPPLLAQAAADEAANLVVAAYDVALTQGDVSLKPVARREQIRAFGPSIDLPVDAPLDASAGAAA